MSQIASARDLDNEFRAMIPHFAVSQHPGAVLTTSRVKRLNTTGGSANGRCLEFEAC